MSCSIILTGVFTAKNIVCVCVFFPFILDIKFVGRTSRGHTGGRSHRISYPPSFCGACLNFSREKNYIDTVCMYVCKVITYSRVWINRVRLPMVS